MSKKIVTTFIRDVEDTTGKLEAEVKKAEYLLSALKQGSTAKIGLVLAQVLAAMDSNEVVKSYMSGDAELNPTAFAAGVENFGMTNETKNVDIRHDGSASFGNLNLEALGKLYILDKLGIERFRFGDYKVSPVDVLRGTSENETSKEFATRNFNTMFVQRETYTETHLFTETVVVAQNKEGSDLRVSGLMSMNVDEGVYGSISLELLKDGVKYSDIGTFDSVYLQNGVKGYGVMVRSVPAGTYTLKMTSFARYNPVGIPTPSNITSQAYNTKITIFARNDIRAVHIGSNGMAAFYGKDKLFHINADAAEGEPFLAIHGVTDIGGMLLSGKVSSEGGMSKVWGAKKHPTNTSNRSSLGVYYVHHNIKHSNYVAVASTNTAGRTASVDSEGPYTFIVRTTNTSGTLVDTAFNFVVSGDNG